MSALSPSPVADSSLVLTLLGAFQLARDDGTVVLTPGKPLALLAYLVCSRHRRASRAAVADLLWGDSPDAQRRASLRQALFTLRNAIGSHVVTSDGEWIEASAALRVDVDRFLGALEVKHYATAVAAYAGDFVPSFAAPGAAEFERWTDMERLRLRGAWLAASVQHLHDVIARGETAHALDLTRKLVELAPHDDEMWRRRFDVLSLAGEAGQMLLEIASLRATRAAEGASLDRSLERHVGKLVGTLARSASGVEHEHEHAPVGIPSTPEFQGRSDAFTALLAAWGATSAGAPRRFIIVGAPGMGKSRLLREFTRRVEHRRVQLITIAVHQRERDDAFAVLAEVVDQLVQLPGAAGMAPSSAAVLSALVPRIDAEFSVVAENASGGGSDLLLRRIRALADLIAAVAHEAPVSVLLDDAHWADDASIKVLDRAMQRVTNAAVLLVATSRHDIPELGCGDQGIVLRPLDRGEVQALITSIADLPGEDATGGLVDRIYDSAQGSPFEVLQLLRAAVAGDALRITDRSWVVVSGDALRDICQDARATSSRLRELGAAAREVLTLLAVDDTPVDEPLLLTLLDGEVARSTTVLAQLERDGMIVRDPRRRWMVAHALIADDIRTILTPDERQRGARRMGEALLSAARDFPSLRRAVRLLLDGGSVTNAVNGAVRWYASQEREPFTPAEFVQSLLGGGLHAEFEDGLGRRLRGRRRWWRQPAIAAALSVAASLAIIAWYLARPARLVLTSTVDPSAMLANDVPFEVPPQVDVQNHLGRRTKGRDGDTVRIETDRNAPVLRGRTTAVLHGGTAIFDSLYPPAAIGRRRELRIVLSGLPPLVLSSPPQREEVRVVDFLLNGRLIRDSAGTVNVHPGDSITGSVRLRYTTIGRGLLYVLAQTSTWREPREDTTTVRSLLAGVVDARLSVPLALRAPDREGDFWILYTLGAEPAAVWLLSSTNWRCRRPIWNDGNDLAAQPYDRLSAAVRSGQLTITHDFCHLRAYREERAVPLSGVRVVVRR